MSIEKTCRTGLSMMTRFDGSCYFVTQGPYISIPDSSLILIPDRQNKQNNNNQKTAAAGCKGNNKESKYEK